eukprot:1158102-Pelagomonas_calceolata.AAC.4
MHAQTAAQGADSMYVKQHGVSPQMHANEAARRRVCACVRSSSLERCTCMHVKQHGESACMHMKQHKELAATNVCDLDYKLHTLHSLLDLDLVT